MGPQNQQGPQGMPRFPNQNQWNPRQNGPRPMPNGPPGPPQRPMVNLSMQIVIQILINGTKTKILQ